MLSIANYTVESELPPLGPGVRRFVAVQERLRRKVELRLLDAAEISNESAARLFVEELRMLLVLDHPAVMKVLDVGVADGRPYYATDLRSFATLRELLAEARGPMPPGEFVRMALEICDGLTYLHGRQLVVRRLDPDTIHFNRETLHYFLGDTSGLVAPEAAEAPRGEGSGRLDLPEGRRAARPGSRGDLFLFGACLYQACTGLDPWPAISAAVRAGTEANLPVPSSRNPELPRSLDAVIMKNLAFEPEDRHASSEELADALRRSAGVHRILEEAEAGVTRESRRAPAVRPRARRGETADEEGPAWSGPPRAALIAGAVAGCVALAVLVGRSLAPARPAEARPQQAGMQQEAAGRGAGNPAPVTRQQFEGLAGAMRGAPTDRSNFLRRWELAHRYLSQDEGPGESSAQSGTRMVAGGGNGGQASLVVTHSSLHSARPGPGSRSRELGKLLELRFVYFREPREACAALDLLVTRRVAAAGGSP